MVPVVPYDAPMDIGLSSGIVASGYSLPVHRLIEPGLTKIRHHRTGPDRTVTGVSAVRHYPHRPSRTQFSTSSLLPFDETENLFFPSFAGLSVLHTCSFCFFFYPSCFYASLRLIFSWGFIFIGPSASPKYACLLQSVARCLYVVHVLQF